MDNTTSQEIAICWLRRDLRLVDNAALYHALKSGLPVLPLFIFDKHILDALDDKADKRVQFIYQELTSLKKELQALGSDLLVYYDNPQSAWKNITKEYTVKAVYANTDYEPYAQERDERIKNELSEKKITFNTYKDQLIFEPGEILKSDGNPYVVYTPFSKVWLEKVTEFYLSSYPTEKYNKAFYKTKNRLHFPSLEELGFIESKVSFPPKSVADELIQTYDKTRDFPAKQKGTSHLGLHLRFGTLSIRQLARQAQKNNLTFFKELAWREFFMHVLFHFPHTVNHAFRKEYDRIQWRNNEAEFEAWCKGKTGYPLVDAGMRELNETGYMHNRVRMVVASFLTKHLLIDWRWGERYFAEKLLDYDLSANIGNWQWAAGCGCDAAPYFRVFNPTAQAEKFDPQGIYIRKWVPELETFDYPKPIVDHKFARDRVLKAFKLALEKTP